MPHSNCPADQMLMRFLSGKTEDEESEVIEQHLLGCEECLVRTREVRQADTVMDFLRQPGRTLAVPSENAALKSVIERLRGPMASDIDSSAKDREDTFNEQPSMNDQFELLGLRNPAESDSELGRLGEFRVLKLLGAGGMGVVFLAEDRQLQRRVALKILKPEFTARKDSADRFLREARAAAAIKHEHVVTIYQVGEAIVERLGGQVSIPFLAQELLEGESLEDRLRRESPLPISEAVRIGREISEGLAAAHAKGLIHRDIKPANVWLESSPVAPRQDSRGGIDTATSLDISGDIDAARTSGIPVAERQGYFRVKLLDFGLARSAEADSQIITSSGMIVGTPSYMAPEQASGEVVDARADLFSLGVVLYRMTTGQLPFPGKSVLEILKALATVPPAAPHSLNPEMPRELSDLIERLLAKEAAQRPETAAIAAKALSDLLIESSSPKWAVGGKRADPPKRTTWTLWGAAAIVLLFGVIVIKITDKNGTTTTLRVSEGTDTTLNTAPGSKIEINQNPAANSMTPKPEATSDPDRRVAEWVLLIGGVVQVKGHPHEIQSLQNLPAGEIRVVGINFQGSRKVRDTDLADLKSLTSLGGIALGGTSVSDAGMKHIAAVNNLESLALNETQVTDQGLETLRELRNLHTLDCGGARITDTGLEAISRLRRLSYLTLTNTSVTDLGLARLKNCKTLSGLGLKSTDVTAAGVTELKNALPNCDIAWDAPADATAKNFAVHLHPKQAIVVEGILGLKSDDPLTIELWVQPDAAATESHHWIMAGVSWMQLQKQRQGGRELLVSSLFEDAPGGVMKHTRGFAWAKGQRMHVAAISEHKRTSLYVDGKLIGMAEVDAPRPSTPVKTLRIGQENLDFSGIVDEVRLSRGVRYAKDFEPAARFEPDDDTLVLLHCDEGNGEWTRDASGRGNDGHIRANNLSIPWVRADGSQLAVPTAR